ncbi:MAG: ABC transporter permease [Firmicutes bacterium]|nr:ABC transporter permease [Bacillota bacterium]
MRGGFLALLLLVAWQAGVALFRPPSFILPAPSQVAAALWQERATLLANAGVTLEEILLAVALSSVAGVGLGVAMRMSPRFAGAAYPWLVASQTFPTVAVAPVLVLWLGYTLAPKVLLAVLWSFFPLVVGTYDGLGRVDADAEELFASWGAGRWRRFRALEWPSALPSVFSGLKLAVAFSVSGAVVGEWLGAQAGLGYLIQRYSSQLQAAAVFAAVFLLAALGIVLFALTGRLERRVLWWLRSGAEERAYETGREKG